MALYPVKQWSIPLLTSYRMRLFLAQRYIVIKLFHFTFLQLCILGPIEYRLGTLLLADSHVTVLGGAVEHLVQENCLEKVLAREL